MNQEKEQLSSTDESESEVIELDDNMDNDMDI